MENANKALIIAGGTILGIMILSLLVYLFRAGGRVSQAIDDKQIYYNTQYFNQQFENFAGEDKENNISDLITLLNLAVDANRDAGYNDRKAVSVDVKLDSSHTLCIVGIIPMKRNYALVGTSEDIDRRYRADNNISLTRVNLLELRNKPVKEMGLNITSTVPGKTFTITDTETFGEAYRDSSTNKIVYKYYFKVPDDGIEYYHAASRNSEEKSYDGRVNKITIELVPNLDYPAEAMVAPALLVHLSDK